MANKSLFASSRPESCFREPNARNHARRAGLRDDAAPGAGAARRDRNPERARSTPAAEAQLD